MTVMSFRAPSAPSTMPARTRLLRLTLDVPIETRSASSFWAPVKCARSVNTVASRTVSASAESVPRSATVVKGLGP